MTQIEHARAGVITPAMEEVAAGEQLAPELVRDEVARGRMVIPANKVHLEKNLRPIGIGVAARTKINANIGKSAVSSDPQCELEKLMLAVRCGADTVMDLSTGQQIECVRQRIIDAAAVPSAPCPSTSWRSGWTTSPTCGRNSFSTWSKSKPGRASTT